jgi:uncharacterized protein YdhG (YjbR/CyaY superfamily)
MKDCVTIDDYIASFPKNVRVLLEKLRETIQGTASGAVEVIRYGIPTFQLDGKNLVHFAAFKHHIGLYPTPSAIVAFKKRTFRLQTSEGFRPISLERTHPI